VPAPAPGKTIGERRPFHQFHHQRRHGGAPVAWEMEVLEPVDLRDARMIERSEQPRLAAETHQELGIVARQPGDHLDRHVAMQLGIARPIDLAHPARTERRLDLIRTQTCA
jgi:hypothetical protein